MAARSRHKVKRNSDFIKPLLIAGCLLIAAGVGCILYTNGFFSQLMYDNVRLGERFPIRGIDVSNHNSSIDFDKVAAAGYSFVYIKASEGATFKDPSFKRNSKKASECGLKVGAYHFFRKNRDGDSQARNFMQAIKGADLDMPLVIDIEDWGNVGYVETSTVRQRLRSMAKMLRMSGYKVMIYTNGDGYKNYYEPCFKGEDLWLCTFNDPDSVAHRGHIIQQYSHWGRVDGIKGEVDLNVFMGSAQEWESWLRKAR